MEAVKPSIFLGFVIIMLCPLPLPATPAAPTALILYDSEGASGWLGEIHSVMLGNLLGHFTPEPVIRPVESYQAGDLNAHQALFYLGTVFDHPLPDALITDVSTTSMPVCWFGYNLWQLPQAGPNAFPDRVGFQFDLLDQSGYPEIEYKGERLRKDQRDAELGRVMVPEGSPAVVHARAFRGTNTIPYVVQGGSFWYVADSPFSFIGEEDRYLVIADLLHDILNEDHPEQHPALVRLEDITPDYPTNLIYEAANQLTAMAVPFSLALIPVHEDPLGVFNGGRPLRITIADRPGFLAAIRHVVAQEGQILLHGYTHQYRILPNPYSGVSSDDYEFFRITFDAGGELERFEPVPEDSIDWVQGRLDAAKQELNRNGLSAVGWVTPHYTASALDYQVIATNVSPAIERGLYFDNAGHHASQYFPYPIARDIYGQKILPESLGNLSAGDDRNEPRTVEDILRAARLQRVVRDGWASFFFHPFLDLGELDALVEGIRGLGYHFVPVTENVPPVICAQSEEAHLNLGDTVTFFVQACGSSPFQFQWHLDGVPLAGATNDQLRIKDIQASEFGAYTVQVSNAHGTTTSPPMHARFLATPRIRRMAVTNGVFRIWFNSQAGLSYRAEYKDFLQSTGWSTTFPVIGSGGLMSIDAPLGGINQRFYRLQAQ